MRQKGFTLVELVVVLAVIAILASLALPRLGQSLAVQELNGAAQRLVADLRDLQQRTVNDAAFTGQYRAVFDANGAYYMLVSGFTAIKTVQMPDSVRLSSTAAELRFNQYGRPGSGYGITFYSSRLQKSVYVYVAGGTGRVRWSAVPATNSDEW